MESVREKWTDERLDDMNRRMAEGFQRVDTDLCELRTIIQVSGGLFGTMLIGFLSLLVSH
jgi:hypothetical protein